MLLVVVEEFLVIPEYLEPESLDDALPGPQIKFRGEEFVPLLGVPSGIRKNEDPTR